jgi:hypothetical protein
VHFARNAGDFKKLVLFVNKKVCLPFLLQYFFGDFFVIALRISSIAVQVLHSALLAGGHCSEVIYFN